MLACVCVSSPLTTLNASNSIQFDSLVRSLITANIFIMCAMKISQNYQPTKSISHTSLGDAELAEIKYTVFGQLNGMSGL